MQCCSLLVVLRYSGWKVRGGVGWGGDVTGILTPNLGRKWHKKQDKYGKILREQPRMSLVLNLNGDV